MIIVTNDEGRPGVGETARRLAAGVSTSGWAWKYPGRLCDSPIVGAGAYADSRYGAAACTGAGEMAIRAGTSRSIVLYLKMGLSLDEAVDAAIDDLRGLKGGLISRVTIHAIVNRGRRASSPSMPNRSAATGSGAMARRPPRRMPLRG